MGGPCSTYSVRRFIHRILVGKETTWKIQAEMRGFGLRYITWQHISHLLQGTGKFIWTTHSNRFKAETAAAANYQDEIKNLSLFWS